MLCQDQLIPCSEKHVVIRADLDQPQAFDLLYPRWRVARLLNPIVQAPGTPLPGYHSTMLGQLPQAARL
jgi:hypothetical protein